MKKKRGRPTKYDPDKALDAAMGVFWKQGFEGASLDDLAEAMQMKRPSIYNAFGDKESIYRKAMAHFVSRMSADADQALFSEADLKTALREFYKNALEVYIGKPEQLGCFVTCTSPVEAASNITIRNDLRDVFARIDDVLEKRLLQAREDGQVASDFDVKTAAQLLHATLQTLALRSRSGEDPEALEQLYRAAVDMLV